MSDDGLHIHLDLVGGMAGDMFIAAAIDAGLIDARHLVAALRKVELGPVELVFEKVMRGAIEGTMIRFRGWNKEEESDHRHLSTIREMLAKSDLSEAVTRRATEMFERLGKAEAAVHGMELDDVHFHEVGAVDSILDFVGAAWIIEELDATWSVGPIPAGRGTIETAHGTIPVPAPATAKVLAGFDIEYRDVDAELVTPTGATIVATVAAMGGEKRGTMVTDGFGCGSRKLKEISNVVRMIALRVEGANKEESLSEVVELEEVLQLVTEIDDESPEMTAHVAAILMDDGALDVVCEAVQMKKGRIGRRLTVLCRPEDEARLARLLFKETSTFGIRRVPVERWVLGRSSQTVSTPFGEVTVKVGWWRDEVLKVAPEYDSCASLAAEHSVPLRQVFAAANSAAQALFDSTNTNEDDENGGS